MKISLQPKSYWYVAQNTDMDEKFPGKKRMIQAMEEIYPIIESYDDDLFNIKDSHDVHNVFQQFLNMVDRCVDTPFTKVEIDFNKRYFLDAYCFYDIHDSELYLMPVSFLPDLKKHNKKLHDLVVEALCLMDQKGVNICNDYMDEMNDDQVAEYVLGDSEENYDDNPSEEIIKEYHDQQKYERKYCTLFRKHADHKKLLKKVEKYQAKYLAEYILITWIKMIIRAYQEPGTLYDFSWESLDQFAEYNEMERNDDGEFEFNDGNPVTINQCLRFNWYSAQWVVNNETQWLGDMAGNFGEAIFYKKYRCAELKDLQDARDNFYKEVGYFPEYLAKAIEYAATHIESIYAYSQGKLTENLITQSEIDGKKLHSLPDT
jgi:hypothetical protein